MVRKKKKDYPKIIQMYISGSTAKEVGDRFGRCSEGIRYILKIHNIPTRNSKEAAILAYKKGRRKFICHENLKRSWENRFGSDNPNWKGGRRKPDNGYTKLHRWIRKNKPKSELCECCKKSKPHDLANISQEYKKDINDFEWLCRKCHMKKDGRMKNLKQFQED